MQWKGWRMSCDVGKTTEGLENELWRRWSDGKVGEWALQSWRAAHDLDSMKTIIPCRVDVRKHVLSGTTATDTTPGFILTVLGSRSGPGGGIRAHAPPKSWNVYFQSVEYIGLVLVTNFWQLIGSFQNWTKRSPVTHNVFCSKTNVISDFNVSHKEWTIQVNLRYRYLHYRPWRTTADVHTRVHINTAMALGRGRVASPTLGRLYHRRNTPPVLIL